MRTSDFLTSFTEPALDAGSAQPAARVRVVPYGGRFLVSALVAHPSQPPAFEPFPMPPLPGSAFDDMTRVLRVVWHRSLCTAAWLLYLDPLQQQWRFRPAPRTIELVQQALPADVLMLSNSQKEQHASAQMPERRLLLAGGYTVSPASDPELLARQLPAWDGLSMFWHPGGWTHVTALLTALGQVWRLPATEALRDTNPAPTAQAAGSSASQTDPYECPWISWDGGGQ